MARLGDVFQSVIREIDTTLNKRKEDKREELLKKYFKTIPVLKKKQDLLEKKKNEKKSIEEEINTIETEMRNLDPSYTTDQAKAAYKALGGIGDGGRYYGYERKKSTVTVDAAICHEPEYKNIVSWEEIKKQLQAQFNLCITDKNRQQVIMALQTGVDWKSLGINIPNLFDIKKVDVVDGIIYINKALPNKSK